MPSGSATPGGPRAPYPEAPLGAIVFGVLSGALITVAFTYTSLMIGFNVPGSAIAALLGYGAFRGVARLMGTGQKSGTILAVNMSQTVASGMNVPLAGVVFTVPALFLMHPESAGAPVSPWPFLAAVTAGSVLGVAFIIPLRKQMLDIENLRFPSGVAVAAILRSPAAGVRKAKLLMLGVAVSAAVTLVVQLMVYGWLPSTFTIGGQLFEVSDKLDLGALLRWMGVPLPHYVPMIWAVSMLSIGAGFMSGRNGLTVLIGGILANWIIAPLAWALDWVPTDPTGAPIEAALFGQMNRPVGIGMLIGGAIAGVATTLPQVRAAFAAMRRSAGVRAGAAAAGDELPMKILFASVAGSVLLLGVAGYFSADIGVGQAVLIAVLGTLWMWLAGIIVSQCAGMTDWSPVSGLALIAVSGLLLLTRSVFAAVLVGSAVCVAISGASDMMTDLKTGYLVGARPVRQQSLTLVTSWLGPAISLGMIYFLWSAPGRFGPGTKLPAPQAQALQAAIEGVLGGAVPYEKYGAGALVGGTLSFLGIPGLGVLVGLSMYLPIFYILTYGVGCVLNVVTKWKLGVRWVEEVGVPIAAGLLVGDPLVQVVLTIIKAVKDRMGP